MRRRSLRARRHRAHPVEDDQRRPLGGVVAHRKRQGLLVGTAQGGPAVRRLAPPAFDVRPMRLANLRQGLRRQLRRPLDDRQPQRDLADVPELAPRFDGVFQRLGEPLGRAGP
jgi:hypothetical protein